MEAPVVSMEDRISGATYGLAPAAAHFGGSGRDQGRLGHNGIKECSGPMTLIKKALAIASIAALLVPAAAMAQSSDEGYGGPGNVISGLEQGGGGGGGNAPAQQ